MNIFSIDTSCDETAAAIVSGRKVLSSVIYSQSLMHEKWGGVVPSIAKRAHIERIDWVIERTIKKARRAGISGWSDIDAIAVTYGPGLAIALEVGVNKAIELSKKHGKPIVGVNHMEGHLYSSLVQNSQGKPDFKFKFPYLGLLVSGGHTELIYFKDHLKYEILGEKRDDAAGEALDKAARMLGFGYPGGEVIERLAKKVDNKDFIHFTRPMNTPGNMEFSFSGLKTALYYYLKKLPESEKAEKLEEIASSFQEAVFYSLVKKTEIAMKKTGINQVILGGGVAVNKRLRFLLRNMIKKHEGALFLPSQKYLNFDNAAMIGLVGNIRAEKKLFVKDVSELDRVARLSLLQSSI